MSTFHMPKYILCCLGVILNILLLYTYAFAHRVNIYAYVEGKVICGQAQFSNSKPAIHAKVTVYSLDTRAEILHTTTDQQGQFSFDIPQVAHTQGLILEVYAGQGHKNSWTMPKDEFTSSTSVSTPTEVQPIEVEHAKENTLASASDAPLTPASLRTIIREEISAQLNTILEQKLAPLRKHVAQATQHEPGFTEILGGIGWLVGLAGLFFALLAKRKV